MITNKSQHIFAALSSKEFTHTCMELFHLTLNMLKNYLEKHFVKTYFSLK